MCTYYLINIIGVVELMAIKGSIIMTPGKWTLLNYVLELNVFVSKNRIV